MRRNNVDQSMLVPFKEKFNLRERWDSEKENEKETCIKRTRSWKAKKKKKKKKKQQKMKKFS